MCFRFVPSVSLLLVLLACGGGVEAGQQISVSGVVYLDGNTNETRDLGEAPLPGIHVSNGDEIIETGVDGAYQFDFAIEDPRHIFVTVPTGYASSGPFYRRIILTEATEYEYDFGLVEDPASLNPDFSFVQGADIQYYLADTYAQLAADFGEIAGIDSNAAFATFAGDLTLFGETENLLALKQVAETVWQKRFYAIFGGHDGNNPTGMGNFMDVFGPYCFSWDYGEKHFIGLVSELSYIAGEPTARQFRWLQNDVALQPTNRPIYVVTHRPGAISGYLDDIAATHNLRGIIRGHYHDNNNYAAPGGVPVICTAPYRPTDWGVFTRKCRLLHFAGDAMASSMRVIGQENRLTITSPPPGGTVRPGAIHVQVNAYDTDDPVVAAGYEIAAPGIGTATGQLQPHADWNWWATWDGAAAQPGDCTMRVVVTGRSGQTWERTAGFRLAAEAGAQPAPGEDWPSVQGYQNRTRVVTASVTPPLQLAWIGHTDGLCYYFSSPAVADGKVVIGVTDGEVGAPRAGVVCFDARTGERLWKTATAFDVHGSVAVADGKVFALTGAGPIYGLSLATGQIVWQGRVIDPQFAWTACYAPVTVSDGRVYALGSYSPVFAFDATTGTQVWATALGSWYRPTAGLGVYEGVGYASDNDRYGALDLATGTVLWQQTMPQAYRGKSTPVRQGDVVYLAHRGALRAVAAQTGEQIWLAPIGDGKQPGIPAIKDGRVYATDSRAIHARDAGTGDLVWSRSTDRPELFEGNRWQTVTESSSPAVAGDFVYVGSESGVFYCLDAASGNVLWEYNTGVPIKSAPAISGNMVFFSAFDGSVYAFVPGVPVTNTPPAQSSSYMRTVLASGPEAHYRMDETNVSAGTVLENESGDSSRDGIWGYSVLAGDTVPVAGVPGPRPTDQAGGSGPLLRGFDPDNIAAEFFQGVSGVSTNDMMNIGSDVGEFDSSNMTYSMWFKTTSNDTDMRMLVNRPGATYDLMLVMDLGRINILTKPADGFGLQTPLTYTDGAWHHVVAVRNGNAIVDAELWVDGVDVSGGLIAPRSWFSKAGSYALIGSRGIWSQPHRLSFEGVIDEVTIWDRALTPAEIVALHTSATIPAPSSVVLLLLGLGGLGWRRSTRQLPAAGRPAIGREKHDV